ncbi:MAG: N-acetyl-gamma-glutamyl-phosphate reductase [Actinomycetota bacterium]|nr:N-acetyl-gamma-glutamyl-phosphate reductase [Actinomycetota bacterium]
MKIGIIGASGYVGVELLRLCAAHPNFDVELAAAGGHAGERLAAHTPSLATAYPSMAYASFDPYAKDCAAALDGFDVVFSALPHGQSQHFVPSLLGRVGVVVDLAADFRLKDPSLYSTWYGQEHAAPDLLQEAVYGLPELCVGQLDGARLVAAAGCYPTAAALALAPLVASGAVQRDGILVDAASGVSGAGRGVAGPGADRLQFGHVDGDFSAYGLLEHRHTPEIEQVLQASVLFTPHLAPMSRGILATCYARPTGPYDTDELLGILRQAYTGSPFVVVTDTPPSTKATAGSNCAHVTVRSDRRTGWVLALCALDNLVKGASGQAVQCANIALGLPQATGLPIVGVYP